MNEQNRLKVALSSLNEKELIQFFQIYCNQLPQIEKLVKKISYNCYEAAIEHRHITVNGYGKHYNQALTSAIDNFLHKHLQDEHNHQPLRDCLKKCTLMFNIPTMDQSLPQKMKTLPDSSQQKKVGCVVRSQEVGVKTKQNLMRSVKTLKEEIFQSLNHNNIQLKATKCPNQLSKNSSSSFLNHPTRNQQLSSILAKVKQLEQKLADAQQENESLKSRLKQKQTKQLTHMPSNSKFQKFHIPEPKLLDKELYLRDISTKFNNTTQEITKGDAKTRSYSLSNSTNSSVFNSKAGPKVKIPKLNLEVLPNYHGKSNKSLNHSLLEVYEKKIKGSQLNI